MSNSGAFMPKHRSSSTSVSSPSPLTTKSMHSKRDNNFAASGVAAGPPRADLRAGECALYFGRNGDAVMKGIFLRRSSDRLTVCHRYIWLARGVNASLPHPGASPPFTSRLTSVTAIGQSSPGSNLLNAFRLQEARGNEFVHGTRQRAAVGPPGAVVEMQARGEKLVPSCCGKPRYSGAPTKTTGSLLMF